MLLILVIRLVMNFIHNIINKCNNRGMPLAMNAFLLAAGLTTSDLVLVS